MKSRKVLTLALIATTFLSATTVFASEFTPEDKERAYQLSCVPGSEKNEPSEKDAMDAIEFRAYFHAFLRKPEIMLPKFAALKKGKVGLDMVGLAIELAATCGAANILKDEIQTRGCKDEKGNASSVEKALAVCAPILAWMEQAGK